MSLASFALSELSIAESKALAPTSNLKGPPKRTAVAIADQKLVAEPR